MKTKRQNDKLGYNPETIPLKPNTRYVVSEQSRELWDKFMNSKKEKLNFNDLSHKEQMLLSKYYQYMELKTEEFFKTNNIECAGLSLKATFDSFEIKEKTKNIKSLKICGKELKL